VALARDSPSVSGTKSIPKFSITSIPNDVVVARVSRLGVLLGESPSQIVSFVNLIKDLDLNTTLIMLKKKEEMVLNKLYNNSSLVLNAAN
jgi:hypothetical protein